MTAETDALRLVSVNARDLDALRYVLNRADEASRIRTVMSTFTLPERETTAERLERLYAALKAAAPAVQPEAPAQGSESGGEVEWLWLPDGEKPDDASWSWTHLIRSSAQNGRERAWSRKAAITPQPGPASEGEV